MPLPVGVRFDAIGRPAQIHSPKVRSMSDERPQPARRYNYWLGGKDNYAVDRASGDEIERAFPTVRTMAVENRQFLRRATAYLADRGVKQFIDIGCGLPTRDNTHEIAQRAHPDARVVYVDNDRSKPGCEHTTDHRPADMRS